MTRPRVVVALSGGVDSAVTAWLLKRSGKYDVHGLFMRNWDPADEVFDDTQPQQVSRWSRSCTAERDWDDVQKVARFLDIPVHQVNFVKEYWNDVFGDFLRQINLGLTPNPDVTCNQFIKFDRLLRYAKEHHQAEFLATGHYARVDHATGGLFRAVDTSNDPAYFLATVDRNAFKNTLFPLGI